MLADIANTPNVPMTSQYSLLEIRNGYITAMHSGFKFCILFCRMEKLATQVKILARRFTTLRVRARQT